MKNLYLFFVALLSLGISNAQTIITFEDNTIIADSDLVVGPNSDEVSIVVDPTDATNKVLKITHSTNEWWDNHGGFTIPYNQNGATGGTVTFDIWTDHSASVDAGTFGYMIKLENNQDNPGNNIENSFLVDGAGSWQSVTLDFSDCANKAPAGNCSGQEHSASTFSKILFFHWGGSNPSSPTPDTLYIDNITYQNGDMLIAPAADAEPTTAAPTPTHGAADVMSVYSFHYAPSVPVTNVNPGWGQATQTSFETINGESIVKMKTLNYQGHDLTETDVSSMTHLHADVWSENGGETLAIFPLDGSQPEPRSGPIALQAGWNQVDIELATLPVGTFGGTIKQFKFSNDLNSGANLPLIYVSNLYFYADSTASVDKIQGFEISLYPNPATDIVNINTSTSVDHVRLYDLTGRVVMEANPNKENFNLDVTGLSKGVYLVKLNAGNKEATTKLIK